MKVSRWCNRFGWPMAQLGRGFSDVIQGLVMDQQSCFIMLETDDGVITIIGSLVG